MVVDAAFAQQRKPKSLNILVHAPKNKNTKTNIAHSKFEKDSFR
jgi:hypothetical protein